MPLQRSPEKTHYSNPDLSIGSGESSHNVTGRKRKQPEHELTGSIEILQRVLQNTIHELRTDMDSKLSKIDTSINNIKSDLESYTTEIRNEISALRKDHSEVKKTVTELSDEVSSIKESMQFHSDQFDDLKNQVDTLTTRTKKTDISVSSITNLESKIESMEQQARQCNLEITNLPERRNENLLTLLEAIGKTIGCNISKSDIVSVHRVPQALPDNKRPKNIIAKLTTRTLRDNILSSYRLNKNKTITSTQLGVSGTTEKVFLNEHLTLKNKQLFRKVRDEAKKHDYKYTWIKNATILVRKSDTSPVFAVRSEKDLDKIKLQG